MNFSFNNFKISIRVIIKLPNSEQSYKGKVKTHKFIVCNLVLNMNLTEILRNESGRFVALKSDSTHHFNSS
jgi:hypothetical protein